MPPPPPRPPPGPPPAPGNVAAPAAPPPPKLAAVSVDRTAVLADIQKGARLKKVDRSQIKDRSAPVVGNGGVTGSSGGVSASSSASDLSSSRPTQSGSRLENGANPGPPQQQLGGIFAGVGMPTLRKTGFRQYEQNTTTNAASSTAPNSTRPNASDSATPAQKPINARNERPVVQPPISNGPTAALGNPPKPPPPKPIKPNLSQTNLRRQSLSEVDGLSPNGFPPPPPITSPKPAPTPKPSFLTSQPQTIISNERPQINNGAATVSAARPHERKPIPNMSTMPPQKPKHPPPPLPANPPPTRNISQTMPRPGTHKRPSIPTDTMMIQHQDSSNSPSPVPPPLPGRPPSFRNEVQKRNSGDGRSLGAPPPPPPPNVPQPNARPVPNGVPNGQPQKMARPAPPTRAPTISMSQSGSVGSLADGNTAGVQLPNVRPPKRFDSLNTVAADSAPMVNQMNPRLQPKAAISPPEPPRVVLNHASEFEAKFAFCPVNELPRPSAFSGRKKTYPSAKTSRVVQRPSAPAPPLNIVSR